MLEECPVILPLQKVDSTYSHTLCRGEGIYIYDEHGKRYIDAISGLWNMPLGYNNQLINDSIMKQLEKLAYTNLNSGVADITLTYARKLISYFKGDFNKLIYSCSGSEALEVAIKVCRKYQSLIGRRQRRKIGAFDLSYHGTTYGAMSISGIDAPLVEDYKPLIDGVAWIKTPYDRWRSVEIWLSNIQEFFDANKEELAGVIIEPIIGSGGILEVPREAMELMRKLCTENNVLLVLDEVATGFGRTGKMFAYEYSNIKGDLLCLSKAINNGYLSMGVTLISPQIIEVLRNNQAHIEHFSTQNGDPLACAAAYKTLEILSQNKQIIEGVTEKGEYFVAQLKHKLKNRFVEFEIRHKGLMIGIEIRGKQNKRVRGDALEECLNNLEKRGLLVYLFVTEVGTLGFSLFPSYLISNEEIDNIVDVFSNVINKYIFKEIT